MKTFFSNRNYERINLMTNTGKQRKYSVHRLVALVFIPNSDSTKNIVNHKDGNTHNNVYTNLEWATNSENMIHAYNNDLAYTKGTKCHLSKPERYTDALVHKICKLLENGATAPEIIIQLKLCKKVDYKDKSYNNYRHYINDLKHHKLRNDISLQYAF